MKSHNTSNTYRHPFELLNRHFGAVTFNGAFKCIVLPSLSVQDQQLG